MITTYTKPCSKNVAGNTTLWLTEASNVDSVTVEGGFITSMSMSAAASWSVYDSELDTVVREEVGTGQGDKFSYVHAVEARFNKLSGELQSARDNLVGASPCGILAMTKDGNGTYWLTGYNTTDGTARALRVVSDSSTTGNAPDQEDGGTATMRLECKSGYLDLPVTGSATVAVTGIT